MKSDTPIKPEPKVKCQRKPEPIHGFNNSSCLGLRELSLFTFFQVWVQPVCEKSSGLNWGLGLTGFEHKILKQVKYDSMRRVKFD